MAVDHNNPQSRDEEILIATIDGKEYNKNPQSRMEELLLELKEVIEEGGGGGGTTDYENLSNQPQVNGETLIGDKSGADLGLVDAEEGKGLSTNDYDDTEKAAVAAATSAISAMKDGSDIDSFGDVEVALLDKQDELTAGKYIQITNDEISVKRDIAYEADEVFFAEQTNNGLHVSVTIGSTTLYDENFVTSDPNHTVLDLVQTSFSVRAVRWVVKYLKASKTRSAGTEETVWPSITDTFVTTVDADKKLIIQSEMDAAINSAVSKCYHHAGTKTCAELLPALLIAANEGNVYEMTDSGTTTSDFMEGIGHPIKEGDNVGVARVSEGVYKFDLLSGFVDTTNFVQKSSTSGLIMNDGTIDTVAKQPVTDNNLTTTDKTTTGAINELKSGLTNLDNEVDGDATVYPYADVITIEDAVPANLADCSVKIEPVQDLHGQSAPYVGGTGKNKLPLVLTDVKTYNTTGTWNDNVYSINNGTIEVLTDDADNVIGIKANGTFNAETSFVVGKASLSANSYYYSGSDSGTSETYQLNFYGSGGQPYVVNYTGDTSFTLSADNFLACRIRIMSGVQLSNQIFYPMIRLSTETDATFAPYTNICPITGHTEASVQRDGGKNLLNVNAPDVIVGKTVLSDGTLIEAEHVNVSGYIYVKDSSVLTYTSKTYGVYAFNRRIVCYDENKQFLGTCVQTTDTPTGIVTITGTVLANTKYVRVPFARDDASAEQLEYGTQATPYQPYQGNTYTIALGDTIYGGTVDFDSGVMTVDRALIDLGSLSWTLRSDFPIYQCADCGIDYKISNNLDNIASSFTYRGVAEGGYGVTADNSMYLYVNNRYLWIKCSSITSIEDFNDFIIGKTAVLYIDTPTTIQLTPQQIQLLKGTNTITASTGDISITVNGVNGAIGAVQEQVNEIAEEISPIEKRLEDVETILNSSVDIEDAGYAENNLYYNNIFAFVSLTTASKTWAEDDLIGTFPVSVRPKSKLIVTGNTYLSNIGVQIKIDTDGTIKYNSQTGATGRISFTAMFPIA